MSFWSEKRILWAVIALVVGTTLLDLYTALASPVFELAEANPIYVVTGSIWWLLAYTVVVTAFVLWGASRSLSLYKIFIFMMLAVWICAGHLLGAWSNLTATAAYEEHPEEVLAAVENRPANVSLGLYFKVVGLLVALPVLLSFVAFHFTHAVWQARRPLREKRYAEAAKLILKNEVD